MRRVLWAWLRLEAAYLHDERRACGYSSYVKLAEGIGLPETPDPNDFTPQPPWMVYESREDLGLARAEFDLTYDRTIGASYGVIDGTSKLNGFCIVTLLSSSGDSQCGAFTGGGQDRLPPTADYASEISRP